MNTSTFVLFVAVFLSVFIIFGALAEADKQLVRQAGEQHLSPRIAAIETKLDGVETQVKYFDVNARS